MLNAFCRVAPSVRFSVLAIRAACVFFRASAFNVRTCSGVHSRRFVAFLAIQKAPNFERGDLVAPHLNKFNAKKVQRVDNGICLEFKFAAARGTDREDLWFSKRGTLIGLMLAVSDSLHCEAWL